MTTRLIITDRGWAYQLQAAPQEPGKYFCTLRTLAGAKLEHAVAAGPFLSLDYIQAHSRMIYRQLVSMRKASAAVRDGAPTIPAYEYSGPTGLDQCAE